MQMTFLLMVFLLFVLLQPASGQQLDVPFVATPHEVVEEMLNMANVGPGDYVIDLGSGDGRIVIAAARRGAVGHGVDLDPELVAEANRNAKKAGVDHRVSFRVENVYETDYTMATVITMYLLTSINVNLKPFFFEKLKPGTRIVSHIFDMRNWQPDKRERVNYHNIYYWNMPADAEGKWYWELHGNIMEIIVEQVFQEITVISLHNNTGDSEYSIREATLYGDRFIMITESEYGSVRHIYQGKVYDDRIEGSVQIQNNEEHIVMHWKALRYTT